MSADDIRLLQRIAAALSAQHFAARVDIGGGIVLDRATARAMERNLLRLRASAPPREEQTTLEAA